MNQYLLVATILAVPLTAGLAGAEDDPIFSGPQVGEKLPAFKLKSIVGQMPDKEFDPVERAGEKPIVLIFFHERTRPAFGLTNTVMRFAASRARQGLTSSVVFLTEDATETERWIKNVQQNLPKGGEFGISPDGQEGPGAYGLNRNVGLTVLVGKGGKVTANFALVQPSIEADGPKILKAIADVTGGGPVPGVVDPRRPAAPAEMDPKLTTLLRTLINKEATPEEVEKSATAIEAYIKDQPKAKAQLARVTVTVANSGKLENYGIPTAQAKIKEWARRYGAEMKRERD